MITASILIALTVNGLMMSPAYIWLIEKLNLDTKPFNCLYCLAWWSGVVYATVQLSSGFTFYSLSVLLVPLAASFLAVVIDRWFNNQPVRIK